VEHLIDLLRPLLAFAYPDWLGGGAAAGVDAHHAFFVQYSNDTQRALDVHMDQSELTLNVNLNAQYSGGGVLFGDVRDGDHRAAKVLHTFVDNGSSDSGVDLASSSYAHRSVSGAGRALLHRGQHWHEATPIESGTRVNLIIWLRASAAHASPSELYFQKKPIKFTT
jgi:hypothetical protein